jgi:hypothetical protein
MSDSERLNRFFELKAEADRLDALAGELCELANDTGTENEEFEVRERAGEVARQAMDLAAEILQP